MPPELTDTFANRWGLMGVLLLAALVYHKPIIAALVRTTRDPLIEALAEQNRHFADNNALFQKLGPQLAALHASTAATADGNERLCELMTELLAVQRGIKEELIRRGHA